MEFDKEEVNSKLKEVLKLFIFEFFLKVRAFCNPGCPGPWYVVLAGLELLDPLVSVASAAFKGMHHHTSMKSYNPL